MWDEIKSKIHRLAQFDKTKQVFGARYHKYQFGRQLTEAQMIDWEEQSSVALPHELRAFFLECGNGGAGPYFGMKGLQEIDLYEPNAPFRDADYLRALAKERYDPGGEDFEYYYAHEDDWDVAPDDYQGMIAIIECGCGGQICAVTNGEKMGQVVFKTADYGLWEIGTLLGEFHRWFDEKIMHFETVIAVMSQCKSAAQLHQICVDRYQFYQARDYMVSYLGIAKPARLFGENETRYHGATQFPWYDQQFPR
jgi:hypothetical protein